MIQLVKILFRRESFVISKNKGVISLFQKFPELKNLFIFKILEGKFDEHIVKNNDIKAVDSINIFLQKSMESEKSDEIMIETETPKTKVKYIFIFFKYLIFFRNHLPFRLMTKLKLLKKNNQR